MFGKWVAVLGMLTFGTASSIMSKINFEVKGMNTLGKLVSFHKPWFCVLVMFIGMSGCIFLYLGAALSSLCSGGKRKKGNGGDRRRAYDARDDDNEYLKALINNHNYHHSLNPGEEKDSEGGGWRAEHSDEDDFDSEQATSKCSQAVQILMIVIPTAFDLIATVLMSIGLLYVTVSIYQMMRGAELIFAAIFSVAFLGKKLYKMHYVGILLSLVGISTVGVASVLSPNQNNTGTKEQQVMGILLIILSQAIQAGQICFEEHFMRNMEFMKPTLVVGLEGVYGVLLQTLIVLPVAQRLPGDDVGGKLENTVDSLHMITASKDHVILFSLSITAVIMLFYNVLGMQVTGHLGALFRSILETTRTLLAWIVGLILYYSEVKLYGDPIGEAWTNYSYLQAAGFVVLVIGTLIYAKGDELSYADQEGLFEVGDGEGFTTTTQAINIGAGAIYSARQVTSPVAASSMSVTPSRLNAYYDFSAGSLSRSYLKSSLSRRNSLKDSNLANT